MHVPEPFPTEPLPAFPTAQINIHETGMIISFLLAPGLSIQQGIDEENMNAICERWLQTRRAIKKQLLAAQGINRTTAHARAKK
jgi:hypothetical protein